MGGAYIGELHLFSVINRGNSDFTLGYVMVVVDVIGKTTQSYKKLIWGDKKMGGKILSDVRVL